MPALWENLWKAPFQHLHISWQHFCQQSGPRTIKLSSVWMFKLALKPDLSSYNHKYTDDLRRIKLFRLIKEENILLKHFRRAFGGISHQFHQFSFFLFQLGPNRQLRSAVTPLPLWCWRLESPRAVCSAPSCSHWTPTTATPDMKKTYREQPIVQRHHNQGAEHFSQKEAKTPSPSDHLRQWSWGGEVEQL